jgi:hypothetical protein
MIEAINAIEALDLFWFVRRCDIDDPSKEYRAVVWQGVSQGNLMVSAESGSPTTALALAGRAACRQLGLAEPPPIIIALPAQGAVYPRGSQGGAL